MLLIVVGHKDDTVLAEIFATLGKLAVRNEFCQRIVDLGGLDLMLNVLHNNVKNKVGTQSISNSFYLLLHLVPSVTYTGLLR